ncbi:MAG: serine/threonine protein kinase [Myxococcales bacterium]|nr:serine/threonine protein kinase [Myxococcales bacterium]
MASDDAATLPSTDRGSASADLRAAEPERYILIEQLGAGGMGVVWAAYDRVLDRKVALKLLHDRFLGAADQARLAREARAMAQLSHPNVVPVFDVGERDGRTFLTMEFVRGRALTDWLEDRPAWPAIVEVFRAAAGGLAAAHAAGIVHKDVKPGNILVGDDGRVRVADFGVAGAVTGAVGAPTAIAADAAPVTVTVTVEGTPAYMAPEQLRGEAADARSDVFSLCVALHEACGGSRPFAAGTIAELRAAIDRGPPPLAGVPDWLARLVARGLAVDPAARFSSMDALAAALAGPGPSWRRRAAPYALAVVAVGALGGAVIATRGHGAAAPPPPPSCAQEAATAFGETWSAPRRAALIAGFRATARAGAGPAGERTAAAIDALADGWRARSVAACQAVRDHSWSADLGGLAATCLAEHRGRLGALIDGLTEADAVAVASGHDLVARLAPPSVCGDPDYLRGRVVTPRDPARAAELDALTARGEAVAAAITLQRWPVVEREVPPFRAEADRLDDARSIARALQFEAALARQRADWPAAVAATKQAYLLSRRHRDVEGAADAAASLVWLLGYFQSEFEAGEDWAALALVEIDSVATSHTALLVHQAVGILAEHRGQGARAVEHQRRAYELALQLYGADHVMTARAAQNLAGAQFEAGDAAAAAALYRQAMPKLAEAFGPTSLAHAHALSHFGVVLSAAGDHAAALDTAARAVAVGAEAGAAGEDLATLQLNQGAVLLEAGRLDDAIAPLVAARAGFLAADQPEVAAQALSNLGQLRGDLAARRHDPALARQAIADLTEAARALEAGWGADHPEVAYALANLAVVYVQQGQCARALPVAERAAAITGDAPDTATPLVTIARCRLAAGQAAAAVTLLQRARALQAEGQDPVQVAEAEAWLGLAQLAAHDDAGAARLRAARPALVDDARQAELVVRIDRALTTR